MREAIIVIPYYKDGENLPGCVDRIKKLTHYPYKLWLYDDGSGMDDEGIKWAYKSKFFDKIHHNTENLGVTKNINLALADTAPADMIQMDSHTWILTNGWLKTIVDFIERKNPDLKEGKGDVGVVSALGTRTGELSHWIGMFKMNWDTMEATQLYRNIFVPDIPEKEIEVDMTASFCCYYTREAINAIGVGDEKMWGGYRDKDYCLGAKRAGFRVFVLRDVHAAHVSYICRNKEKHQIESGMSTKEYIKKKWGIKKWD